MGSGVFVMDSGFVDNLEEILFMAGCQCRQRKSSWWSDWRIASMSGGYAFDGRDIRVARQQMARSSTR